MNSYKKINYINGSEPSISAENLNHMDDGIEATTTAITKIEMDIAKKANTADVNAALSKKADKTSVDSALSLKQDKSNMFSTKQNLTDKESSYPSVKFLENYYYNMDDVDTELDKKAGLDAYENVVRLSTGVDRADLLNDCTNANKTYVFNVIPPMSTDLSIASGCNCIVNYYDNLTQTLRTVRYQNKVFIREYNSTKGTWSDFKEITIPDRAVTKEKLSYDLQTELELKADTATTLSGYGITDAYTKKEVDTAFLNNKTIVYLKNTITDIDSFLECDSTDKIYIGMMKGFSTTFGYSSDTESKGFRMWFIPELVSGEETSTEIGTPIVQSWYRVVMFEDGTIWTAPFRNTTFTQISYSKTQVENLLDGKYNASNVEYGSGTLTGATGYENETATFNYQKVGNLVTVIGKATFSGENTTLVRLEGLPYRSTAETMYVYTQFRSSKSKWMMVNTNYSVLEVRHSTSGQVFEAEETLRFAISYYTA